MPLSIPTVHLNGTSRNSLIEAYNAQWEVLDEAIRTIRESDALNARDYYVQHSGAFAVAVEQHEARLDALRKCRDEIYMILESLNGL